MNTESAIDLSVKSRSSSESEPDSVSSIVRPIPRPPWSIIWYQSLWPSYGNPPLQLQNPRSYDTTISHPRNEQNFNSQLDKGLFSATWKRKPELQNIQHRASSPVNSITNKNHHEQNVSHHYKRSQGEEQIISPKETEGIKIQHYQQNSMKDEGGEENQVATIIDVACCDGPIRFERISNPNFALTVEHQNEPMGSTTTIAENQEPTYRSPASKTYVCIYCSQSFKSLFCYQKHKKRHLNPVSVDITTNINTPMVCPPESRANTKDLNVQFFPCKKCGCKFPSYYFVKKHRETFKCQSQKLS